jgi:hypothetical protein
VTRSYKLDVTPQQAYFRKNTLPEVAQRLTGDDGLEAQVQCAARPPKNYVQCRETDFNILRRADDHDCWIRPTPTGVEIRDRFQPGTTLERRGEDGLLEFRISGELGQPSFIGTHYNPRKMSSRTFTAVREDPKFSGASRPMVGAVQRQSARPLLAGRTLGHASSHSHRVRGHAQEGERPLHRQPHRRLRCQPESGSDSW